MHVPHLFHVHYLFVQKVFVVIVGLKIIVIQRLHLVPARPSFTLGRCCSMLGGTWMGASFL